MFFSACGASYIMPHCSILFCWAIQLLLFISQMWTTQGVLTILSPLFVPCFGTQIWNHPRSHEDLRDDVRHVIIQRVLGNLSLILGVRFGPTFGATHCLNNMFWMMPTNETLSNKFPHLLQAYSCPTWTYSPNFFIIEVYCQNMTKTAYVCMYACTHV